MQSNNENNDIARVIVFLHESDNVDKTISQ